MACVEQGLERGQVVAGDDHLAQTLGIGHLFAAGGQVGERPGEMVGLDVGGVGGDGGVDGPAEDLEGGEVVGLPDRLRRGRSVDGSLSLPLQVADGGAGRLLLHGQVPAVLEAEGVDLGGVGGAVRVDGDGGGADVGHSRAAVVDAVLEQLGFLGGRQHGLDDVLGHDGGLQVGKRLAPGYLRVVGPVTMMRPSP